MPARVWDNEDRTWQTPSVYTSPLTHHLTSSLVLDRLRSINTPPNCRFLRLGSSEGTLRPRTLPQNSVFYRSVSFADEGGGGRRSGHVNKVDGLRKTNGTVGSPRRSLSFVSETSIHGLWLRIVYVFVYPSPRLLILTGRLSRCRGYRYCCKYFSLKTKTQTFYSNSTLSRTDRNK